MHVFFAIDMTMRKTGSQAKHASCKVIVVQMKRKLYIFCWTNWTIFETIKMKGTNVCCHLHWFIRRVRFAVVTIKTHFEQLKNLNIVTLSLLLSTMQMFWLFQILSSV